MTDLPIEVYGINLLVRLVADGEVAVQLHCPKGAVIRYGEVVTSTRLPGPSRLTIPPKLCLALINGRAVRGSLKLASARWLVRTTVRHFIILRATRRLRMVGGVSRTRRRLR